LLFGMQRREAFRKWSLQHYLWSMERDPTPRIDLRLLRQFVAVAEELHFRRAAERLSMSQPPLTAAVRRLEQEIGATLIERGQKTVRLTEAGAVLLVEARRLLDAAEAALTATRDAAAGRRGVVRLGYVGSAMHGRLPAELRRFRRAEPGVRVELREMTTTAQISALRAGELDLAIVIPPLGDPGGLHTAPFDRDRLAMALSPGHRLAGKPDLVLRDLADDPFICWPRAQGPGFHDHLTRLCVAAGFVPNVVQEAYGMQAVLSLVAAEAGVAVVPESMATSRGAEVVCRPIEAEGAAFELLLCRSAGEASPATTRLEKSLRR